MTTPILVREARRRATESGFGLSCENETGRLLGVLAAAVGATGQVLELGTGSGVGLAWIVHGLADRTDVRVVSVESDAEIAAVAADGDWPAFVELIVGDGLEAVAQPDQWDLVFADAQGGKWDGLSDTIASLRPGGVLVVDDMTPAQFMDDNHRRKTKEVRDTLLGDDRLRSVELAWSTGLILATRVR